MTINANVKLNPYNATGNGTTDDRAAIQAAIDAVAAAGGRMRLFPKGTYLIGVEPGGSPVGGLQMKSKVALRGEAPRAAVLKLANGANKSLLYGPSNVDSLWGTDSLGGLEDWSLFDLELDGNKANNSSGNGLWIYGFKPIVENLFIRNVAEHAWRTEWGPSGDGTFGMEGAITNVKIDTCGKHGFWFCGPHDSVVTNVIVIDPSQATHNTYDGIRLERHVSSRFVTCHSWCRSPATPRTRYGVYDTAGHNDFIGGVFEGAYSANVYLESSGTTLSACEVFAAGNGVNILIKGTEVVIKDTRISDKLAGAANCKGVVLGESGDWVAACDIDVFVREQIAGAVDFTYSSGANSVRVRGYLPAGTLAVGTPQLTDDVDMICSGGGGGALRQTGGGERYTDGFLSLSETDGITAAGTTQGTATQLPNTSASHVTTVAANTGVILPNNTTPGKLIYVHNSGANTLKVYPATGQKINNLATNAAFSIGTTKGAAFIYNSDRWMPLLSA